MAGFAEIFLGLSCCLLFVVVVVVSVLTLGKVWVIQFLATHRGWVILQAYFITGIGTHFQNN